MDKKARKVSRVLSLMMVLVILFSQGFAVFAEDVFAEESSVEQQELVVDENTVTNVNDVEEETVPEDTEVSDDEEEKPVESEDENTEIADPEESEEAEAIDDQESGKEGEDLSDEPFETDGDEGKKDTEEKSDDLPKEDAPVQSTKAGDKDELSSEGTDESEEDEALEKDAEDENETETPLLRATKTQTVLTFTSDIHNQSNNTAANRLDGWLDDVIAEYGGVDVMSFCGDMGSASGSGDSWWSYVTSVKSVVDGQNIPGVYTTGNHEFYNGSFASTSNAMKSYYKVGAEGTSGSNYRIYCLGTDNWNNNQDNYTLAQVETMTTYLNSVGNDKPIIILTHFPLHSYSSGGWGGGRTTTNASQVIDALNSAANSGKKIVLLWGHNHTMSDTNYDEIFAPGHQIEYSSGNYKTANFYYAAAGCMSDSEYGSGSAYVKGKGLVITINNDNQLSFTYYDANHNNVTEGGTYTEQDPVGVTGVTIDPATVTVLEKKTVQLKANVSPSDATNKGVRWSSSDTGKATVDENGLVRGVSEGSAVITVTTVDGGHTATCQVTVSHNDNPSEEYSVDITPTTDNPAENISINVGDTLVINVTNGSTNSAYNFTATLSNSGIAQIQGNATVNIAAGGNGQITVTGLTDGTVDITIQNENSYGSQYVRKGVIHLTVGEGGSTPVDPPVGDTVNITPTTDNPEENIKINVGDTLVINVTNGSTNSAYNFTATLSNSGIAQIQGNATVNIAAGGNGQITVTGLADGTVDITIQNENSYGSQYVRKGVIHLTVGEGGSTPVDPPVGDTVNITPTTDNPEENIKINVGDALVINVNNGSTNSAYNFTATLSNSGIAQIQGNATVNIAAGGTGQITVIGVKEGTVDITIQNENSYGSQYVRKGVIHLTVGEGGSTPVDPPVGDTVNITPTTDNPEENIKINVGDTLVINVTNGSTNSAYNFTATLSNSGIAQIQGNATVNIAAGGNGQITVTGVKEGTVDITIQNENSYGSQYVRKGVIHLTVGEGGSTPVDPPVGDTVTYQLVTSLEDGEEYIIANGNTGTVYVLSNVAGSSSRTLKGISANVVGETITLSSSDAEKAAFTVELKTSSSGAVSAWLKNNGKYLYTNNANGLTVSNDQTATDNTGKFWHYKADGKYLLWYFKDTDNSDGYTDTSSTYKYYLSVSSGNFTDNHVSTTNLENTSTPKVYLFKKTNSETPHEHTYGEPVYEWSADNSKCTATATCSECDEDTEGHTVTETVNAESEVTVSPTCASTGTRKYTAAFTNELFANQTKEVDIPKADHAMTHHAAVPATCTADGTKEYYSCSVCNKNYSDEAGTAELTSIVAPATGHDMTAHKAAAATCTEAGNSAYWSCSNCSKYFSDAEGTTEIEENSWAIAALGHTEEVLPAVAPTCTESGLTEGKKCSVCGEIFAAQEEIPATGHKWGSWAYDAEERVYKRICENDPTHTEIRTIPVTSVKLNKTSTTITVGETETLTAIFTPAEATNINVTWSSIHTDVATVDSNGKVTAVSAGETTIVAIPDEGGSLLSCSVTVVEETTVAVTGVKLNKSSISLAVGKTETLTATVSPADATNKNVTWSSSNTSVATVDSNGKVTAKGAGTATITVKTEDGGKTAKATVEVTLATMPKAKAVAVYNSANGADIRWKPIAGVRYYAIWRKRTNPVTKVLEEKIIKVIDGNTCDKDESGNYKYIDEYLKDKYTDSGKQWEGGWVYYITCMSTGDEKTAVQGPISNKLNLYRLKNPVLTKVTANGNGKVTVEWTHVTNTHAYEVQYTLDGGKTWIKVKEVEGENNLKVTVTGLPKGQKVNFRIRCRKTNANLGTTWSEYSPWKSCVVK